MFKGTTTRFDESVSMYENGDILGTSDDEEVWTGLLDNSKSSYIDCGDWLDADGKTSKSKGKGSIGYADQNDEHWIEGVIVSLFCCTKTYRLRADLYDTCDESHGIYCLETEPYALAPMPPSDCHVMFVSRATERGNFGTGIAAPADRLAKIDAICNQEAAEFGTDFVKERLSAGYVAWLSVYGQVIRPMVACWHTCVCVCMNGLL
jgi:hypothetical protein